MLTIVNGPRVFVPPPPYRCPCAATPQEAVVVFLRELAQDRARSARFRTTAARLAERLELQRPKKQT